MNKFIACLLLIAAMPSGAMRCGNDIVAKGDHLLEVLEHCGEPDLREEYVVRKPVLLQRHPLLPYYTEIRPVSVRQWTYNFGNSRFMRQIRFEDGVIREIETKGRGFH